MNAWLILYLLVFLATLALSALACKLAFKLGERLGWMDIPSGRKAHARPIALTGGYGIFAAFILPVLVGLVLAGPLAGALAEAQPQLANYLANITGVLPEVGAVLLGAAIIFTLGAVDDRRPLGPRLKLAIQCAAVVPLITAGIYVRGFLPDPVGWALTLGWIVLLTNSFNLLDNMDGQTTMVGIVICFVLSLAAFQGGELWLPALFLTLAGALAGFLIYNYHPARMFMGDAGALTTGYLLAVFSILVTYYSRAEGSSPTGLPVLMPLAIMGVPLFDTLSVMFIRWRAGKPLMVGDRNHFSHRLLAMGFSVRGAGLTIALLTLASGLLALPLRVLPLGDALLHLAGLAALFGVIIAMELIGRRQA